MNSEELNRILEVQQRAYSDATQMLFNSLNQRIEDQNKLIYELKSSLEFSQAELKESRKEVSGYKEMTNELKKMTANYTNIIDKLQLRMDLQEDYSRSNNIRIEGIQESSGENNEQLQLKIRKLLSEKMQMNDINIDKIHRVANQHENNPHPSHARSIIMRLQRSSDRNLILKNSYKLKSTGIFLNDDVSEGTMKIRKEKMHRLKEAKSNGKIAYFIGRKLIIHNRNNNQGTANTARSFTPPRRNSVSNLVGIFSPSDTDTARDKDLNKSQSVDSSQQNYGLRPPTKNVNYKV